MLINPLIPLALPVVFTTLAAGPSEPLPIVPPPQEELVIGFEGEGTSLKDFIEFVSKQLGQQIFFDRSEIQGALIQAHGAAKVAKSEFRQFVETTLYAHGFVLLPLGDALRLTSLNNSRLGPAIRTQAEFVPLDKLDEYEGRYVVITCVVYVGPHMVPRVGRGGQASAMAGGFRNVAQEYMSVLQAYFSNPMTESVRSTGEGIVMTGFPHVVRHAVEIVRELESQREAAEAPLAARVAELEAEIQELRQAAADAGDR